MKNALLKDTYREIKRSLSRFLSIFAIVALGVAFFAGVKAAAEDMEITGDKYFDDYHLMDIKVLSTMGFDDEDVKAIGSTKGLEGVMATYSMDAMAKMQDKETVIKVLALPTGQMQENNESYLNRTVLLEGRYPEKPNECLTEKGKMLNAKSKLGTKIKLTSGTEKDISESLAEDEYTIVGIVDTPYYISYDRGSSTIGSGKVNGFIMIPQENFKLPVYTEVFLTVKGTREAFAFSDEYKNLLDPVKESLKQTGKVRAKARYNDVIEEATTKLNEAKQELAEGEAEANSELDKAAKKLADARIKLDDGEKQLLREEQDFKKKIADAKVQIAAGFDKLESGEAEYAKGLKEFNESKSQAETQLAAAEKSLAAGEQQIAQQEAQLNGAKTALAANPNMPEAQKSELHATIAAGEQQLAAGKAQLAASRTELEKQRNALAQGEAKLKETRATLDASRQNLLSEQQKLESSIPKAEKEFANARKKLADSKIKLQDGEEEYQDAKQEAETELADARIKIADAEEEIRKLEEPNWYVLDRNANPGYADYEFSAERVAAIAQVFPVFFFLIAALVCLTTMTRMVDEQRTYIGTLKALGYSKLAIASKYLAYAALASLGGSIFGVLLGFQLFPKVIFNAYAIMFTLPDVIAAFNVYYAVLSTSIAVGITTLAAWFACNQELKEEPSILMRPKAPKAGKRILLENIKFVWSRLSFTQKVTARNIFRYKKRFLMTILGIGGCTALVLSGFGLRDSIISIAAKQFDELYQYDMMVQMKKDISLDQKTDLMKLIDEDQRVSDYMLIREQSIDIGKGSKEKTVSLVVPESIKKLEDFVEFRNRTTGAKVALTEEGIVLSEKLSNQLQAMVGDSIFIKDENNKKIDVKVVGITEHYISHYVYMSPKLYESVFNKDIRYKQIMAKTIDTTEEFEKQFSTELLKNKDISAIRFTSGISTDFKRVISSLNYVVLVLIISAGALAFVVLYNLTNINVTERIREIATIKVLGFFDREVSAYVDRESVILTVIGTMIGLVLGIFFHRYIIVTAEVDYVMFGRTVSFPSYIYAALLTFLFSALVNLVIHFKLKKVNMVESLKSVD